MINGEINVIDVMEMDIFMSQLRAPNVEDQENNQDQFLSLNHKSVIMLNF